MEIVNVYDDSVLTVIMCAIITIGALILIVAAIGGFVSGEYGAALALLAIGILLLFVWKLPIITYYDAIITDWNAVYEQGYEVVETNGKVVTLRKVDE